MRPRQGQRGKPFQPGPDPRRHIFTPEECSAGFWRMVESIATRYPNATNARGHMVLTALPALIARKSGAKGGRGHD